MTELNDALPRESVEKKERGTNVSHPRTIARLSSIAAITAVLLAPALSTAVGQLASAAPAAPAPANGTELAGKTIFLDPGHQGSAHSESLTAQVPDGRGGTKDCQTTGMTSLGGVPEHTINWDVSQLVKSSLEGLGAKVLLSRADDSGWGGCVDQRAKAASDSKADIAVSIHADSTTNGADTTNHGFHVIVPTLPVPDATVDKVQSGAGRAASTAMRDAYTKAGFVSANYAGVADGLQQRSDIAGPNLTTVPLVFVEMGNGSNPDDAKMLESSDGQVKYAIATITGIVDYLLGGDTAAAPATTAPTPAAVPAPTASVPTASVPTASVPTASVPPASVPAAAAPATRSAAPVASTSLARQFAALTPLFDALGLDGIERLLTDKNASAIMTIVVNLFTRVMSGGTGSG